MKQQMGCEYHGHGFGHGHGHGFGMRMMGGICPVCGMGIGMMGGTCPMCGGGMGMMGGMGHRKLMKLMKHMAACPVCGQAPKFWAEGAREGPYRGKGPAKRSDEQIKAEVEEALTDDSWLDASGVQVNVQGGVVTLTGVVDSRESKRRAEDLADRVSGVRDVQNNLRIEGL